MGIRNSWSSDKAGLPTQNSSPIPPPPPSSTTTSIPPPNDRPTVSQLPVGDVTVSLSPPLPAYSPPSSLNTTTALPPNSFTQGAVDADLLQYNLAHGRGGGDAVIARCLPERFPFPSDTRSLASNPGLLASLESLPAYGANLPPRYTSYAGAADAQNRNRPPEEPKTLPRTFFRLGFFFPVLWVCGAVMLFKPCRFPNLESVENGTEAEEKVFMDEFQAAERKWAMRCLFASLIFILISVAFAAMVYSVVKSTSNQSD